MDLNDDVEKILKNYSKPKTPDQKKRKVEEEDTRADFLQPQPKNFGGLLRSEKEYFNFKVQEESPSTDTAPEMEIPIRISTGNIPEALRIGQHNYSVVY